MKSKGLLLTLVLLIGSYVIKSQNLVPNAGFETITTCPSADGQIYLASPWQPLDATPDLFNTCFTPSPVSCADGSLSVPVNYAGKSMPHSGNGYAGILASNFISEDREYVAAPLSAPLMTGKIYKTEAWFRRSSNSDMAVSTLGITLSVGAIVQYNGAPLGFPPQVESSAAVIDTANWTKITGYIVAAGGENYITIGNFKDNASSGIISLPNSGNPCNNYQTAYYYVDDISVTLINEQVNIQGDTIICPGNSTTLTAVTNTTTWWSLGADPTIPLSNAGSITVSPSVNTTYILNGIFYKDSVVVQVIDPPLVNLQADTTICENSSVLLDATNLNSTYSWSTGETTPTIIASEEKQYWVEVDNGGCATKDTFNLSLLTNPPINLGKDTTYCAFNYDFITLNAGVGVEYLWQPTLETTRNIIVRTPGAYTVNVNFLNGCSKAATIKIKEICEPKFYVPSCFTPNDDGLNDVLCPSGNSYETFNFMVFNRWGDAVFTSANASSCWNGMINGKKAPTGIYAYSVQFTAIDELGKLQNGNAYGTVLLIR